MRSYTLSPYHEAGRFCRTIRVPGREPRFVQFTVDSTVELDAAETAFMADEIARGWIGLKGVPFKPPTKPGPPRLDPSEDDRDFAAEDREMTFLERWRQSRLRREIERS